MDENWKKKYYWLLLANKLIIYIKLGNKMMIMIYKQLIISGWINQKKMYLYIVISLLSGLYIWLDFFVDPRFLHASLLPQNMILANWHEQLQSKLVINDCKKIKGHIEYTKIL